MPSVLRIAAISCACTLLALTQASAQQQTAATPLPLAHPAADWQQPPAASTPLPEPQSPALSPTLQIVRLDAERAQLHRGLPITVMVLGAGTMLAAIATYNFARMGRALSHHSSNPIDAFPYALAGGAGAVTAFAGLGWLIGVNTQRARLTQRIDALEMMLVPSVDPSAGNYQLTLQRRF